MCQHGNILRSSALLFNEDRFQEELVRERTEKDLTNKQNSIPSIQIEPIVNSKPLEERIYRWKDEKYNLGDFVYVKSTDEKSESMIICIESFEDDDYFNGLQFVRPNETFHQPTQKFLRQEVFLCQSVEQISMKQIQGLCYVSYIKDYFKYQPVRQDGQELADEDVYVCESRYNSKTKIFKKVKWWNLPENKRIKLIQRDNPLENIRLPSTFVNNHLQPSLSSTIENGSNPMDVIERSRETILYDAIVNEKFNENASIRRDYYEQIVLSINQFYKVGDFVYFNQQEKKKKAILKIEKIWKDNE